MNEMPFQRILVPTDLSDFARSQPSITGVSERVMCHADRTQGWNVKSAAHVRDGAFELEWSLDASDAVKFSAGAYRT